MPEMEGWLEYARNGRMAGVCHGRMVECANRRKDVWSMSGDVRMEGVSQEAKGWLEYIKRWKYG
jgi:hypothetical protein